MGLNLPAQPVLSFFSVLYSFLSVLFCPYVETGALLAVCVTTLSTLVTTGSLVPLATATSQSELPIDWFFHACSAEAA
jgi:hypothetical protein